MGLTVFGIGFFLLVMFPTAPAHAAVADWSVKGATFVPQSNTDYSSDSFKQSVRNFQSIGGNTVNLVVPLYQSNTGSTDINPGWNTPTDDSLVAGIQYVHSLGMKVQLSIYLESYSGEWRAYIDPGDRDGWYARYGSFLVHYGQIAGQQGVELYLLGAELIKMAATTMHSDNTQRWDTMIDSVRKVYGGKLTYSANRGQGSWQSEMPNIGFWDKLDYVGVSAYYSLGGDDSLANLEQQWKNWSDWDVSIAKSFGKPVIFTEIGYRSLTGAHVQPWDSWSGGNYDPQEQVNDYQALFEFWNKDPAMQGLDLWWWSTNPNYGGAGNTDFTPQNKPAQDTIKQWWTGGGSSNPPPPSGPVTFMASGAANPNAPAVGQTTTLTATVNDTSGVGSGIIVDMEVYSGGSRVFQQYVEGQSFTNGQTRQFNASWTPSSAGDYTFKIGVFTSGWAQNLVWNDNAATIHVGSGGGTTPPPNNQPPSGSAVTDIWWPTDGAHVTGLQPFKAMLENTDVSQYTMFWQVDGDGLVQMDTNNTDWPHKEALVDLSGWNWKGAGPYTITFVSKNGSGVVISQKSAQIFTQ